MKENDDRAMSFGTSLASPKPQLVRRDTIQRMKTRRNTK